MYRNKFFEQHNRHKVFGGKTTMAEFDATAENSSYRISFLYLVQVYNYLL